MRHGAREEIERRPRCRRRRREWRPRRHSDGTTPARPGRRRASRSRRSTSRASWHTRRKHGHPAREVVHSPSDSKQRRVVVGCQVPLERHLRRAVEELDAPTIVTGSWKRRASDEAASRLRSASRRRRSSTSTPARSPRCTAASSRTYDATEVFDVTAATARAAAASAPRACDQEPGAMDPHRVQVHSRRRRVAIRLRPQRRHVQGVRHLGVAVRGRECADHPSVRCSKLPSVPLSRSGRIAKAESFRGAARRMHKIRRSARGAEGARQGEDRPMEISALDRCRRKPRPDPRRGRSSGSSCGQRINRHGRA